MPTEILQLNAFNRTTPVVIETGGGKMSVTVNDVLNWIAPGAPLVEVFGFLRTCQATGLDPWAREIYLMPMGESRWATVIAKAGYLRKGMEKPSFKAFKAGIVVQRIDPAWKPGTGPIRGVGPLIDEEGSLLPDGHRLLGGWCRVWKHWEEETYYNRVSFQEFDKGKALWKVMPCVLIRKVAIAHTFREAFNMTNTYDEAEVPDLTPEDHRRYVAMPTRPRAIRAGDPGAVEGDRATELLYDGSLDPHLPPEHVREIPRLIGELGLSDVWLRGVLEKRGVEHVADLSIPEANYLIGKLQEELDKRMVVESFPEKPATTGGSLEPFLTGRTLGEETAEVGGPAGDGGAEVPDGGEGTPGVEAAGVAVAVPAAS